jgi:hypothetical protein
MRYRPIDRDPDDARFGRFIPDDWEHVAKYPLSAVATAEIRRRVPVVLGVNWYVEMGSPTRDPKSGEYFMVGAKKLTRIRGGHCVCLEPGGEPDRDTSWDFYDQGREGACVGYGWSRCMTILNGGERYTARWLWDRAKEIDEWPDTKPGDDQGTSVRAAGDILSQKGHVDWTAMNGRDDHIARAKYRPEARDGIQRFRWARTVEEVHFMLDNEKADKLGAVPVLNSWGRAYPHRTWMPDDVLDRLIREDGEVAIPTDR